MDALTFIREMLSQPKLTSILSDTDGTDYDDLVSNNLNNFDIVLESMLSCISENDHEKVEVIQAVQMFARTIGEIQREVVQGDSRKMAINSGFKLFSKWKKFVRICIDRMVSNNYWEQTEAEGELEHRDNHDVLNSINDTKRIQDLIPDKADSSICLTNEEKCRALLLTTAFPGCREPKEPYKMLELFLEVLLGVDVSFCYFSYSVIAVTLVVVRHFLLGSL